MPDPQSPGLAPSHVGVVGAGQLGRMMHQAAIPLGIDLWFMGNALDDSAAQVSLHARTGSAMSPEDLAAFADVCPVVTFEHEVVHLEALAELSARTAFRPGHRALSAVADKIAMRTALADAGLPIPAWQRADTAPEVMAALERWPDAVVKLSRGGYDGRGVFMVDGADAGRRLAEDLTATGTPLLVEPRLDFDMELAVIVARRPGGDAVTYDPVATIQVDGQCRQVVAPAAVSSDLVAEAQSIGAQVAEALDVVGLVAVELFVVDGEVSINELAVRPHNTGHHTIDAAVTSQFENHVRAVADMPLGDPSLHTPAVMVNVIGNEAGDDPQAHLAAGLAADAGAHIHLYGKEARPNRKVGHVTVCDDDVDRGAARAWRVVEALRGDVPDDMGGTA
ncbi:MAG: 5-(carboxyamino)imidazole ribonucleotide synthase [Actinomycetota bacterium]